MSFISVSLRSLLALSCSFLWNTFFHVHILSSFLPPCLCYKRHLWLPILRVVALWRRGHVVPRACHFRECLHCAVRTLPLCSASLSFWQRLFLVFGKNVVCALVCLWREGRHHFYQNWSLAGLFWLGDVVWAGVYADFLWEGPGMPHWDWGMLDWERWSCHSVGVCSLV